MSFVVNKAVNYNGKDMMMTPLDIDFANRTIHITEEIDESSATLVNAALRSLSRDSEEDITVYIQSTGGSVSAGMSIYDTAKAINCDIVTVACGMAASMAAFLLTAAGTKGKRWCQPHSKVLIHQPLGGISGQATDIMIHANHILRTREEINEIFSDCTGQSVKKIEEDTERDTILSAEEALEYGLVDRIGDPFSEC